MTEKEYRAYPAISRSALFRLAESPEKFKFYEENPPAPTPALLFGQLFHKMALQPETLWEEFIAAPDTDRRTRRGKEEYAAFAEQAGEKTVVAWEDVCRAREMCAALNASSFVGKLLSGEKEVPYFWQDDLTGEMCKCRADCVSEIGGIALIVDLKSTANASTDAFMREAVKYGYDLQAAMYCEGVKRSTGKAHGFVFIAIEKEPPYAVNILQADKLFLRRGYDVFRELIGIYHECRASGNWYGYLGRFDTVNNLSLPAWLAKEVE